MRLVGKEKGRQSDRNQEGHGERQREGTRVSGGELSYLGVRHHNMAAYFLSAPYSSLPGERNLSAL